MQRLVDESLHTINNAEFYVPEVTKAIVAIQDVGVH